MATAPNKATKKTDVFVYSRLASSQIYQHHEKGPGDLPVVKREVFIEGGAGVADKRIMTPLGKVTRVTAEDYALLQSNELFKLHKQNGFITVESAEVDVEAVVADMGDKADPSAPLTMSDFEDADGVNMPKVHSVG